LVTSDEKTNFAKCFYIDDALIGCQRLTPSTGAAYRTDRGQNLNYVAIWVGNNGGDAGPDYESINPIDIYIKSMRVWECSSYATPNWPGSTWIDDGDGLTYWKTN